MSAAAEKVRARDTLDASYSPIGGLVSSPEHPDGLPFMVRAAEHVRRGRYGYAKPEDDARARTIQKVAFRVQLHATEDDELFPGQLVGLPLEGVTRRRLRLVSEILNGYPVRYWSVNDEMYGRSPDGSLGVFTRISMPGVGWSSWPQQPNDLRFATSWDERETGPACGGGTSHVMGLGVLARIEVLSMDPWDVCEQCGCWRPRSCLRDVDAWMFDDPSMRDDEYYLRLECATVSAEGYCR